MHEVDDTVTGSHNLESFRDHGHSQGVLLRRSGKYQQRSE